MRKILITGGLGFVGRQLVTKLVDHGDHVVVCDLLPAGQSPEPVLGAFSLSNTSCNVLSTWRYSSAEKFWDLVNCPLDSPESIQFLVEEFQPDLVFHLAAQSSAGLSFSQPRETFSANLFGTLNLFEAVRAQPEDQRPTILSIGSCEEYGTQTNRNSPLTEDSALFPVSPYGVSKAAQTILGQQYYTSFGIPIIMVRAFNHIGPGKDTRFAFASFAEQIAQIENKQSGDQIAVGDLSPVRDFLDVRAVLDAYCLLIEKGSPGLVYNVCSGQALTIQEGLEILLANARCPIDIFVDPDRCRPADIPYMVGDNSRLNKAICWQPCRSISQTLAEMMELARKENL